MFGYLHRGIEKLAEKRSYPQNIPYTDRFHYLIAMINEWAYVMAVEKLAGIEVPDRAEHIRVIIGEMTRIVNHMLNIGFLCNELGFYFTPLMYFFQEREKFIDLFEMISGQRITFNYMRVGGVSQDLPPEFLPALDTLLDDVMSYHKELEDLLKDNEILNVRLKGTGVISQEDAINASLSGPLLRSTGVDWDLRRDNPYSLYEQLEFDVITGENGDNFDRYRVRMEEIKQSVHLIRQAMNQLPEGDIKSKVPRNLKPPAGEVYSSIESPVGELGFYLVSDGSANPYRFHCRAPSFINITGLPVMTRNDLIADLIVTFGLIDICLGEIDR